MNSPDIILWVLITDLVFLLSFIRVSSAAAVTTSQPSRRSAPPSATCVAVTSSGCAVRMMWLVTAPPFCASPAISKTEQPILATWAAMPMIAPMVTTPVPPTPVRVMPYGRSIRVSTGSATGASSGDRGPVFGVGTFLCPPITDTKLGQNPLLHE